MSQRYDNFANIDDDYSDLIAGREWLDIPEQRLIWAIIERAVRDALGNQPNEVSEAKEWLWTDVLGPIEEFGFLWCCEALGLEPEVIRTKVLKTRQLLHKSPLQLVA